MRVLLDTHVLIWWTGDFKAIPKTIRDALRSSENEIYVSAASAWEIATKVRIGKLPLDWNFLDNFDESVRTLGFEPLLINSQHAVAGASLSGTHKDPFDRMLAGQAQIEDLTLVSADPAFKLLGVETVW